MLPGYLLPVWNSFESGLANHLWQSTLFAALAGGMTLLFRKNSAIVRYRLWLIASVKFLIPFSLLIGIGSHLGWPVHSEFTPSGLPAVVSQIGQPFTPSMVESSTIPAKPSISDPMISVRIVFVAVWGLGAALVLLMWCVKWIRVVRVLRRAEPMTAPGVSRIRMLAVPGGLEPGVFGILRPVLLLPEAAALNLNNAQMEAIIAHEMVHVRGRDNLAAFVHTIVEAVCWFHPLVWWIGNRLVDERERACDEAVLQLGYEPADYAAGILTVCECYLKAPACMAGVSGINLKKRIEGIMDYREPQKLNTGMKLMLASAVAGIFVGPIFTGMVKASMIGGASTAATPAPVIEIASEAVAAVISQTTAAVQQQESETTVIQEPIESSRLQNLAQPSLQEPSSLEHWPEDVQLIITDSERVAFGKLRTDMERETFIAIFWMQRDPTPGTPENEFKDEYYSRVAYADAQFKGPSGDPGSKTDRGKTYILLGPPDGIQANPMRSTTFYYSGPQQAGNNFTSVANTPPYETWHYRHVDGKGDNIIYQFVDKQMNGDFTLEYDPSVAFNPKSGNRTFLFHLRYIF